MNHLILYAHPNPRSFNAAILDTAVKALTDKGHQVTVRDLYELNFDPVLKGADFEAFQTGNNPPDIAREQAYIRAADVITLIYPVWWAGIPALLKGYIDRVFAYGFAYQYEQGNVVGLLAGKKGLIITTQGTPTEHYDAIGMTSAMRKTADTGILAFCGIESLEHLFFGAVPAVDNAARREMLETLRGKFDSLF
ncbi:MAG: NAD(P)H-dependent oxidoreductase [Sporomusaceae bacterium]|nr:NAD(P)H-dependent oxidoreductase [Sporomusaceae bacterium]